MDTPLGKALSLLVLRADSQDLRTLLFTSVLKHVISGIEIGRHFEQAELPASIVATGGVTTLNDELQNTVFGNERFKKSAMGQLCPPLRP